MVAESSVNLDRIYASFEAKIHDSQLGIIQGTKAMKTELQRLGRDIASHSEVIEYLKQATIDEIAEAVQIASVAHPEADRRRLEAFAAFLRGGR